MFLVPRVGKTGKVIRVFAGMVVRIVVNVAGARIRPASTVPVTTLEAETVSISVNNIAAARAERARPRWDVARCETSGADRGRGETETEANGLTQRKPHNEEGKRKKQGYRHIQAS